VIRLATGRLPLGRLPAALARRYGSRVAIEGEARTWTYRQLADDVDRLAATYPHLSGQTVLLRGSNEPQLLVRLLALSLAGAVVAPVKARLPDEEVVAIADATGATAGVAEPGLWLPELSGGPPTRSDTAVLLCTSGTTGAPKAAALSHRGLQLGFLPLLALPVGWRRGPRRGRDAVLAALPLTHVMGLSVALASMLAGVPWIHRCRFDADAILDLIEARRPNTFVGVPTMFADLEAAGASDRDLSSIQLFVSSADAMPTERARRFQGMGATVVLRGRPLGRAVFVDTYGMVELSGPGGVRVLPPISLGLPVPYRVRIGLQVRAVDPEGRPLRMGAKGELQFRGPGVMSGYRGRDGGLTDGWLSTGDHGRVLPGGLFLLAGRDHDRLKVGGFSVFPAEVEAVLDAAPGVREVAVVGLPDPRLGDRPIALVVADEDFDPDAFLAWAREHLAGYRRPREAYRVEALPRGRNDKLDRGRATDLGQRVAAQRSEPAVTETSIGPATGMPSDSGRTTRR